MELHFEPEMSNMLDEGMSNLSGKERRQARRAARKSKRQARKDAKHGVVAPLATNTDSPKDSTSTTASTAPAPSDTITPAPSTSGDSGSSKTDVIPNPPADDSDKIFGYNKYAVYTVGGIVIAGLIFGGYKLLMGNNKIANALT